MESIDDLICTLEILNSALSARDEGKALEALRLLLQQFTATFEHATRIFLAILFLQTLKIHILCGEYAEAKGGAWALLARLRAVNAAIKRSRAQSVPTDSDASAEEVLDDVMNSETTPRCLLSESEGEQKIGLADTGAPKPGHPLAAYPLSKFIRPGPQPCLPAFVGTPLTE